MTNMEFNCSLMEKKCPFKLEFCNEECALYINPSDLNEYMTSKLSSLGILKRDKGYCSLKVMALSQSRYIFEHSTTNLRN